MDPEVIDRRLGRIEADLRSITDALIKLAAVEERMSAQTARLDNQDGRLSDHEQRVRLLEQSHQSRRGSMSVWERLVWVGATIAAAVAPTVLK